MLASLTASTLYAYSLTVPERIAPAAIQVDEKLLAQAAALPKEPSVPSDLAGDNLTVPEFDRLVNLFTPSFDPYLGLSASFNQSYDSLTREVRDGASQTDLRTALTGAEWTILGVGLVAAAIAAVCIFTAGVLCALVLIVAVIGAILLLWAESQLSKASGSADGIALGYMNAFEAAVTAVEVSAAAAWVLLQNSEGTFASEAEAAALAQLGRPWSQANDSVNSTIAGTFAELEAATFSQVTANANVTIDNFADTFTGAEPGCGVTLQGAGNYPPDSSFTNPYESEGSSLCGDPDHVFDKTIENTAEAAVQLWSVGTPCGDPLSEQTTVLYIPANVTYAEWGTPGDDAKVYNLSGGLVGTLPSPTANGIQGNWTYGSGGFVFCQAGAESVTFAPSASFPITDATEEANEEDGQQTNPEVEGLFGSNPTLGSGFSVTTYSELYVFHYGDIPELCATIYGNASGIPSLNPAYCSSGPATSDQTYDLYSVAQTAEKFGEAYWAFLTYLGFSNANQLPEDCLIPTPSSLIPPSVSLSDLEGMSVFQLLVVYTSLLAALNATFNNTATMPTDYKFTVCGLTAPVIVCGTYFSGALNQTLARSLLDSLIPTDPNWWTCSFGFASQGIGYLYVAKGATGTMGDTLADARTWGAGGLPVNGTVAILPSLGTVGPVPLYQTYQLPEIAKNPTDVWVSPYLNYSDNATNPTVGDPKACVSGFLNDSEACVASQPFIWAIQGGNSTNTNGSALGTAYNPSAETKAAIYLVGCEEVSGNGTIFDVNVSLITGHGSACSFKSLNWTWTNESCQNGNCSGGCSGTDCCLVNCGSYNFCLEFPLVNVFTVLIGNGLSGIPFVGTGLGQAIGCVVGIVVLIVITVFVVWLVYVIVRRRN